MTHVDPDNAAGLAAIAREIGAEVLTGALRYPSETGGWQLGEVDLGECLLRHRDRRPVLILAPVSEVEPETFACGICGFVMALPEECPRCGWRRRSWRGSWKRAGSSRRMRMRDETCSTRCGTYWRTRMMVRGRLRWYRLEKRRGAAGLRALTWHDFRRTFAGNLLDNGNDLVIVQKLLGHASPTTTAGYDRRGEEVKRRASRTLHVPYVRRE